jgi:hypothetical protein
MKRAYHSRGPSRAQPDFIEMTEKWKYDWLECCKMLPSYLKMLQRRVDMELLGVWLENIEHFERTTKELKGWGSLTEVILKLEGDRKDSEVLKRIQEVKSD